MGISHTMAQAVLDWTLEHDGGTFDSQGFVVNRDTGYALSIHPEWTRTVPLDEVTPTTVTTYFHDFQGEDRYIGTWVHDGSVVFDVVTIEDDFEQALFLAHENDQEAIYSFSSNEEINVEGVIDYYNYGKYGIYHKHVEEPYEDDFPEYLEYADLPWGGDDTDYGEDLWNAF